MSKRKYILMTAIILVFLCTAFMLSFNWGMKKFNSARDKERNISANESDKYTSNTNSENIVSPNAKITLKIEYGKSGDTETKALRTSDYAGKSKSSLEGEGYVVESMTSAVVNLYKKVDSYAPNKYILGVKDDCFAIFKTDENGNMFIENESTDVTEVKIPTKGDYNLLVKGSKYFQFDKKEEAEEKLGEYSS